MISVGVFTPVMPLPRGGGDRGCVCGSGGMGTAMGPAAARPPLLAARDPATSDMGAFSSSTTGVKGWGARMASSSAYRIALAVRRETRRAGCGGPRLPTGGAVRDRSGACGTEGVDAARRCCED
jgi:hypothetical protein